MILFLEFKMVAATRLSEALVENRQYQYITKIDIHHIDTTSSGKVWNEMINEIAAYIDPETGLGYLELFSKEDEVMN